MADEPRYRFLSGGRVPPAVAPNPLSVCGTPLTALGVRSRAHEMDGRGTPAPGHPPGSAPAAGAISAVAGLTLDAAAVRATELGAAHDFFGHDLHLLFGWQPAGAITDMAVLQYRRPEDARRPEEAHIERLQLLVQGLQLADAPSGVRDLVSDQVPQMVALRADVCGRTGEKLAHLPQGETQSLGAKEELQPPDNLHAVQPIAGV